MEPNSLDPPKKEEVDTVSKHSVCRCCLRSQAKEEVKNMQEVFIGGTSCTCLYEELTKIKMDFTNIPATICNSCTKEFMRINDFILMLKASFYSLVQADVKSEECEINSADICSDSSDDDIPLSQRFEVVYKKPLNGKKSEEEVSNNIKVKSKRGRRVRVLKEPKHSEENDSDCDIKDWLEQRDLNFENDDKSVIKNDFECTKCHTSFNNYKDIETHAKEEHHGEASCVVCSKNLANPFALIYHMMVKHGKLKCCRLCLVSFKNSKEQMEHYKSEEHNTKCNVCGEQFKKRKALYEHRRKKHLNPEPENRKFKCPECSKEFTNRNNIKRHVMVAHCDVRFLCDTCGQSYTTKRNLRIHIQKFHEGLPVQNKPQKKCFFCELCGKELRIFHKYAIALHRAKHKGHKHVCKRCYDSFETEKQLRDHMTELKHDLYECDKCPAQFVTVENFKTHLKNHEAPGWNKNMFATWGQSAKLRNEKGEFVCTYCPKVFKDKQRLDNHVRVHTNERPYKCHICSKGFKTWIHRKTHLNIHLGIKKWVCKFCSKAFTNSCTLKGHEMIHTGERPHPCPDCKKGFITVSAMKRHRMVHLTNPGGKEKSCGKKEPIEEDPLKVETPEQEDTVVVINSNQDLMFKYGQIFSGGDMTYENGKDSGGLT
ncbi:zinc finger protein 93-like isoform X2 [Anthonomus grandis grandis]|uniref:zinc finger protein 93-like isoform X2 n=1 Tax=Anthonomus grandis grandis TaxID=2921223 RepID=UPI002165B054|nr:zinc finger protein 93-like isoform X2 [Anthonomus grandis grandis]